MCRGRCCAPPPLCVCVCQRVPTHKTSLKRKRRHNSVVFIPRFSYSGSSHSQYEYQLKCCVWISEHPRRGLVVSKASVIRCSGCERLAHLILGILTARSGPQTRIITPSSVLCKLPGSCLQSRLQGLERIVLVSWCKGSQPDACLLINNTHSQTQGD